MSMRLVYDGCETLPDGAVASLGGKGANLQQLQQRGLPVPPFFVISTAAFREASGGDLSEAKLDPEAMRSRLQHAQLTPVLKTAVLEAHGRCIPRGATVAVRSSAEVEDGDHHSFAGIYDSVLGVRHSEALFEAIKQVWASALGLRAVAYRKQLGLTRFDRGMAVIVQQMVDARSAGVCFTCNPLTGSEDEIVIHSLLGVGEGLVSHGLLADSFVVAKRTLDIQADLSPKRAQFLLDLNNGGLRRANVEARDRDRPSLSDEQVLQIARVALAIEADDGRPQDVEFCIDAAGAMFILQSRPVTSLGQESEVPRQENRHSREGRDPAAANGGFRSSLGSRLRGSDESTERQSCPPGPEAGHQLVWDNSNIIESYSGVTTPMTFSFIRRAYSIVYHCFAEVMGISPRTVHQHRDAFDNMLGLFRGRVYYNLKNWYQLVQLFPGYQYNRRFMELMMGLKDPLLLNEEAEQPALLRRWFVEFPALLKLLIRSGANLLFIRRKVADFERHFQQHFDQWSEVDFDNLAPHEVMRAYATLEDALLWNWKAPIINDFYVMVFYGVLKKLCTNWCGDETGALQNGLICGEGGLQSDEPAKMLLQMAALVRDDETLRQLVLEQPVENLPVLIAADPRFEEFNTQMRQYLDKYGLRCVGELKLEEYSYCDQPHRLYLTLRDYLSQNQAMLRDPAEIERREQQVRADAETQCLTAISESRHAWWRRLVFRRVLRNARLGVRNRENMRFARTRIYGILRSMLRSIGKQFAAGGVLDRCEDIFYLTLDEVWDFIKGTAVSTNLRELASLRRAEYDRYRDGSVPAPDDRFVTYGTAYQGNSFRNGATASHVSTGGLLMGIGCCPGIATGEVQVIHDPARHEGFRGDILVAQWTDPGWVPLYPAFSGILIERGSVLSHSAIVAREMGIPTIVGISGLTEELKSGQRVRMDGRAGTVERLDSK